LILQGALPAAGSLPGGEDPLIYLALTLTVGVFYDIYFNIITLWENR